MKQSSPSGTGRNLKPELATEFGDTKTLQEIQGTKQIKSDSADEMCCAPVQVQNLQSYRIKGLNSTQLSIESIAPQANSYQIGQTGLGSFNLDIVKTSLWPLSRCVTWGCPQKQKVPRALPVAVGMSLDSVLLVIHGNDAAKRRKCL